VIWLSQVAANHITALSIWDIVPALAGQDIAEAYGAVEIQLERVLSPTGTTRHEYVVLGVLAARSFESPASLHEYLAAQRQLALSPAAVSDLLAGLRTRADHRHSNQRPRPLPS
jgi:hypothetical protein